MTKQRVPASQGNPTVFRIFSSSALSITLFALLFAGGLACTNNHQTRKESAKQAAAPPQVPDRCILRPEFATKQGRFNAGTAFPIEVEGQPRLVVLTAVHLFGPDGGLPKSIPAAELPDYINSVALYDAFTDAQITRAGPMISIPDAVPFNRGEGKDLAAFWASKDGKLNALRLAESRPKVGDTVWLAASVLGGAPPDQRLHRAVVRLSEASRLEYEYDNSQLNLRATSGAPILNAEGNVVGINVGGRKQFGTATALEAIKALLAKALNQ